MEISTKVVKNGNKHRHSTEKTRIRRRKIDRNHMTSNPELLTLLHLTRSKYTTSPTKQHKLVSDVTTDQMKNP